MILVSKESELFLHSVPMLLRAYTLRLYRTIERVN